MIQKQELTDIAKTAAESAIDSIWSAAVDAETFDADSMEAEITALIVKRLAPTARYISTSSSEYDAA